jgi:hypothetical protein
MHPAELHSTLTELRCTLLIYTLNPILSYAEPYKAMLYPTELRCSLLNYVAPSELHYSLTELPSVRVYLCAILSNAECWTVRYRNKGTPVRYRTEMLDAGSYADGGGVGEE